MFIHINALYKIIHKICIKYNCHENVNNFLNLFKFQNMKTEEFNRNEKQQFFSTIKGVLKETDIGTKFSSLTLEVGHERVRPVNLVFNNDNLNKYEDKLVIGSKVSVAYYITSRKVDNKWVTMANVLNIFKI
jgi:hypothetical protein